MTTTPDPLALPPMTALRITDSSGDPGYAIQVSGVPSGAGTVAWTLARLHSTRDDEKAA